MTAPDKVESKVENHRSARASGKPEKPADKPDDSSEKPTNPSDPIDHADDDEDRVARRAEDLAAREQSREYDQDQPQPPLLDDGGAGHGVAKPPVGN